MNVAGGMADERMSRPQPFSVGPLTVLCNVLLVHELLPGSLHSVWLAVPILLVLGAAVGAVNGVLVSLLRYQPVIATLRTKSKNGVASSGSPAGSAGQ